MAAPAVCEVCGRELVDGEDMVCLHCRASVRDTLYDARDARIERLPYKAPVARVVSWLPYTHDSSFSTLLRRGKYDDRPDLVKGLASMYASMLMAEDALAGVDVLTPVAMHWWKRMRRGYNQARIIADTVGEAAGINVAELLMAGRPHRSQARSSGIERAENIRGIFSIAGGADVAGKHVGIVDDILTTGATLSEAIDALLPAGPSAISVYTLAITMS